MAVQVTGNDLVRAYEAALRDMPTGGTERERQAYRNGVMVALQALGEAAGIEGYYLPRAEIARMTDAELDHQADAADLHDDGVYLEAVLEEIDARAEYRAQMQAEYDEANPALEPAWFEVNR